MTQLLTLTPSAIYAATGLTPAVVTALTRCGYLDTVRIGNGPPRVTAVSLDAYLCGETGTKSVVECAALRCVHAQAQETHHAAA